MTEYYKPDIYAFRDVINNANINNKATDNNLTKTYNNKITENTLSFNLNASPSLYYNRYNQIYKNKYLDTNKGGPMYDYEGNSREPQFFTTNIKNGLNKTPPLEISKSRY